MGLHLSENRPHDIDRAYTDEELGITPPPGFRWDILAVFGASALSVVFIALIVVMA
jgi:hypothetical protein